MTKASEALEIAEELGIPVLPCWWTRPDGTCACGNPNCANIGKHPLSKLVKHGSKDATTDPDAVAYWWRHFPEANPAVATGESCWVLDLDGLDGIRAFEQLAADQPDLPDSPRVLTGGGGMHIYFAPDPRIRNAAKIGGHPIDVRGVGGYVLCPPSDHASGKGYQWQYPITKYDLEPAPDWVLNLVLKPTTALMPKLRMLGDFDTQPGAVQGERNHTLARLAGVDLREHGPSVDIFDRATRWGARCTPPMDEDEVRRTVMSIMSRHLKQMEAEIEEAAPPPAPVFERITCAELDATDYEMEYLIKDTLVAGQPCILAGAKKCLKTTLSVEMGLALATARPLLGELAVERPASVGIMTAESGLAVIQETARRICHANNVKLGHVENLIWCPTVPKLGDIKHLEALDDWIAADGIEVLFVDPTYLAMPGADAANLFIQGEYLRCANEVCQPRGVTLVLIHHTKKTGRDDPWAPPELEDIAWAGFQEFARQWVLLGRRERYNPGTFDHKLWLTCGGSAGHSALYGLDVAEHQFPDRLWEATLRPADEVKEEHDTAREEAKEAAKDQKLRIRLERDRRRVVDALVAGGPMTKTAVRSACGLSGERIATVVDGLVADGQIMPCRVEVAGRKLDGYRAVLEEE